MIFKLILIGWSIASNFHVLPNSLVIDLDVPAMRIWFDLEIHNGTISVHEWGT